MLIKINESVREYWINFSKDGFRSERDGGVILTCLGGGLSSDKKILYELDMSRGRNNFPIRVFSLSGEIFGCAIDPLYGEQCKYWFFISGFPVILLGDWLLPNLKHWKLSTVHVTRPLKGWWVMVKVSGGEVFKVKVRDVITILTKKRSYAVIFWSCVWNKNATSMNSSWIQVCFD